MNINITGKHIEVTHSLREHINTKLNKITHIIEEPLNAHITLSVENNNSIVELNTHLMQNNIHLKVSDADMYTAITTLIKKFHIKLNKIKQLHHPKNAKD